MCEHNVNVCAGLTSVFFRSRFASATPKGGRSRTKGDGKVSCAFLSKYTLTFPLTYTHARLRACSSLQGNVWRWHFTPYGSLVKKIVRPVSSFE
jgi:hypothetical protein